MSGFVRSIGDERCGEALRVLSAGVAVCATWATLGCAGDALGLAGRTGTGTEASVSQRVAGGNDQVIVFVRYATATDVAIVSRDPSVPPRRVQLPRMVGQAYSDGRWLALTDSATGSVHVADLNGDPQTNALAGEFAGLWAQVLGLEGGRLLLQAYEGPGAGWTVVVVDLESGDRSEIGETFALSGAIHGPLVAQLYAPGPLTPVPQADGELSWGTAGPLDLADARIELIDLDKGTRETIAPGSFAEYTVALAHGWLMWQEPGLDPLAGMPSRTLVRAYDPGTGATSTVTEVVGSSDGLIAFPIAQDARAIGEAGVVVEYGQLVVLPINASRGRYELRGYDGTTTIIKEYEVPPGNFPKFGTPATVVGRAVVYRDPYLGDWEVYDAASQSRFGIEPFTD